jgi:hypothetical protein
LCFGDIYLLGRSKPLNYHQLLGYESYYHFISEAAAAPARRQSVLSENFIMLLSLFRYASVISLSSSLNKGLEYEKSINLLITLET